MQLIFIGILLLVFGHKHYNECAKYWGLTLPQYLQIIFGGTEGIDDNVVWSVRHCLRYKYSSWFIRMANFTSDEIDNSDPCFLELAYETPKEKITAAAIDKCFDAATNPDPNIIYVD
ncbi:unnamed protein product [Callosobruchus maculatus]|uniref:Uncharacterized protein n=1 Tax=Callosobruchus maculatus TaxID=64391 RepID=A0A653CI06_CALMS|nr:unnamed protein product [Callosobruchus maculatus]